VSWTSGRGSRGVHLAFRGRALAPPKPEEHEAVRGVVVAGRWSLPRSLPGLARLRAGLRGLPTAPRSLAAPRGATRDADPRGLGSPSELSPAALVGLSSTSSRGIRRCWPRGLREAKTRSVERPRLSPQPETGTPPPSTDPAAEASGDCRRASTPAGVSACFGSRETISAARSVLVVSHHLDGFLRSEVAGLLRPAAGHGVRCVSDHAGPEPDDRRADRRWEAVVSSSQRVSHPSKESSPAAAPRHRGRCPLAVGRRAGQTLRRPPLPMNISEPHLHGASTSGLCSAAESGHEADRCRSDPRPVLPWALFPSEVLPSCRPASRAGRPGRPRRIAIELRSAPVTLRA
jgi:hypothetical protein